MVADPGKEWHYNNAASHLLSVIITKTAGVDTKAFAKKYLFDPLNITDFDWAKMNDGYCDGCGLLSIKLRSLDMLKIATLMIDNGIYQNRQVVPSAWIKSIFHPDVSYLTDWGFDHSIYGLDFYHTIYRGNDITYGMGWGGQFLVMIPSMHAVIVTNENTADATAVHQSIAFVHKVFPLIYQMISND